ncbi:cytochrome P450 [Streptomyces sp. NPDC005438]|uniref:cytochrome P450 family protein n=1 Tax=Streptomyces sp. NPDC005438 TaxID=3156880 RepID=UPI0033B70B88
MSTDNAPGPTDLDMDWIQNPHPVGARMRAECPVQRVTLPGGMPAWLVSGYEQAKAVFTDPRFSSQDVYNRLERMRIGPDAESPFSPDVDRSLLNLDPPDHTRLRRLVTKAFTTRSVAPLRPRIEAIADELIEDMAGREVVDIVADYAYPLPIRVICELLGIPFEDRDRFTAWSQTMVGASTPEEIGAASHQLGAYLGELAERKHARPTQDLFSDLVEIHYRGDLTRAELISTAVVVLTGGFETTVNMISSGLLLIMRHPDQQKALREDPSLMATAVEEFLRYETPNLLSSPRYVTEPVEIDGVEIPAGSFVFVSLLSVNRDQKLVDDSDRFDITRRENAHLAFGYGMHRCLGAALARLEGEIAFSRLLDRFPTIEPATGTDTLGWRVSTAMHGLVSLPVHLG